MRRGHCSSAQRWLLPSGAASSPLVSSGGGLELEAALLLLCPSPAHALLFMGSHADGDSLFLCHFAGQWPLHKFSQGLRENCGNSGQYYCRL